MPAEKNYLYSRKYYQSIKSIFLAKIVLLESEDYWWTYDDSAEKLAAALDVIVYHNARGKPGLQIKKNDLKAVIAILKSKKIPYAVLTTNSFLYPETPWLQHLEQSGPVDTKEKTTSLIPGMHVELKMNNEEPEIYYYLEEIKQPEAKVDRNGLVLLQDISGIPDDPYSFITKNSPLGELLLNKKVNDRVSLSGNIYTILRLF